jgi:hypothetical protein
MIGLIIRITDKPNSFVMVLRDYAGPAKVCDQLIKAIIAQLDKRYNGQGWKEFDAIEILGWDDK